MRIESTGKHLLDRFLCPSVICASNVHLLGIIDIREIVIPSTTLDKSNHYTSLVPHFPFSSCSLPFHIEFTQTGSQGSHVLSTQVCQLPIVAIHKTRWHYWLCIRRTYGFFYLPRSRRISHLILFRGALLFHKALDWSKLGRDTIIASALLSVKVQNGRKHGSIGITELPGCRNDLF